MPSHPRKKSTDNSANSSFSSTSSEDDKIVSPFSFDSLQKLTNQTDTNTQQAFIQLDQLYPSMVNQKTNNNNNDDDDDLLLAAAVACTQVKTTTN